MSVKHFIFGGVVGGAIGVAATNAILRKKFEAEINAQTKSIMDELSKPKPDIEAIHAKVTEKADDTVKEEKHEYRDVSSILKSEEVKMAEESYKGYFDSMTEKPLENRNTPTPRPISKNPQIISEEEFKYARQNNIKGYTFEDVIYYADGYVVDSDDEIMHDIYDTVGYDVLEILDSEHNDTGDSYPVYVRNDVEGIYYAVYPSLKEFAPDREDVD